MEVEQEYSSFVDQGGGVLPTRDFFDATLRPNSRFRFPDNSGDFLRRAISLSYRWLDSLAGIESHIFTKMNAWKREPYDEIIQFLQAQGVLKAVYHQEIRYNDIPRFHRFDITASYSPGSTDRISEWSFARASGKNIDETLSKTIGEFLERYFLTLYHKKVMLRASIKSLKRRGIQHLDLHTLAGFSEEQKRQNQRFQWDEDSIFYWEKASWVSTDEQIYLPAQLIYWNYEVEPSEPILRERNTNGAGGYFSREGAVLAGLYELIQRDAFLIHWLNSHAPPKIDPESVPNETFQQILRESKRYGFKVHCLNTTLDTGIPSFIVVVEDQSPKGFGFSMGGGCGANPARELLNALQEAWSVYSWVRRLRKPPFRLAENYRPFCDTTLSQNERILFWTNSETASRFAFFLHGETVDFRSITYVYPTHFVSEAEELIILVKRIEQLGAGYKVYSYLSSHPALKYVGYASAKVIVPQLVSLYLREDHTPLGANRLREVPQKLDWHEPQSFNPWPHPFP